MEKTILLTGGAGYIGSVTGFLLQHLGYDIVVLDSFVYGQPFAPAWATVIKGSMGDAAALDDLFTKYQIHAVMHFAGSIEVGESVKRPDLFYQNNVANSLILLDAMRRHNIKHMIFSSTCAVYGVPQYLPLDEKHPLQPTNPYGKTKLAIEFMLQDFAAAFDLRFVALRYFNAAGALPEQGLGEQHNPETHVIPLLMRAALHKKSFTIFGTDYQTIDGTCVRDYIHVHDLAQAHVRALQYLELGGASDVFNVGTGTGYSVRQLVDAAQDVCKKKIETVAAPRRPGDVATLVASANKINTILGWSSNKASELRMVVRDAWVWEHERDHIKK